LKSYAPSGDLSSGLRPVAAALSPVSAALRPVAAASGLIIAKSRATGILLLRCLCCPYWFIC